MNGIFAIKKVAVVCALLALTAIVVYVANLPATGDRAMDTRITGPDYILSGVRISGIAKDSRGRYQLEADTLRHFVDKGESELEQPAITQTRDAGYVREITADQAVIVEGSMEVVLNGNVVVHEIASEGASPVISKSDALVIQLQDWE